MNGHQGAARNYLPSVSFLTQGAEVLCLVIAVTVSDIYLGQAISTTSQSTNLQPPTTVSKATHPGRRGLFVHVLCPGREPCSHKPLPPRWSSASQPRLAWVRTPLLATQEPPEAQPGEAGLGRPFQEPLPTPAPSVPASYGRGYFLW